MEQPCKQPTAINLEREPRQGKTRQRETENGEWKREGKGKQKGKEKERGSETGGKKEREGKGNGNLGVSSGRIFGGKLGGEFGVAFWWETWA